MSRLVCIDLVAFGVFVSVGVLGCLLCGLV